MDLSPHAKRSLLRTFLFFLIALGASPASAHYKSHNGNTILNTKSTHHEPLSYSYPTLYNSSLWRLGYGYNGYKHDDFKTWVLTNPYYQPVFSYYHKYLDYRYYQNQKAVSVYLSKLYLYYVYIKPKDNPSPIVITLPDDESIIASVNTPAFFGFALFFLVALGRTPLWAQKRVNK